jgi:hypothetical protein
MRVVKFIRNTFISVFALLALFVGAGAAYTWYVGQNEPEVASLAEPVAVKSATVRMRPKPAADVPVSASVQSLTSPVTPGSNASITVRTNPEAKCKITVEYDEVKSKDSGLKKKTSDELGMVSWTWTVEESVPEGRWPVDVTCAQKDKSAVVSQDLRVKL